MTSLKLSQSNEIYHWYQLRTCAPLSPVRSRQPSAPAIVAMICRSDIAFEDLMTELDVYVS